MSDEDASERATVAKRTAFRVELPDLAPVRMGVFRSIGFTAYFYDSGGRRVLSAMQAARFVGSDSRRRRFRLLHANPNDGYDYTQRQRRKLNARRGTQTTRAPEHHFHQMAARNAPHS